MAHTFKDRIDTMLHAAGWVAQDADAIDVKAAEADHSLYLDKGAVDVVEAKTEGIPLPGIETRFTDSRDPAPINRNIVAFLRPSTRRLCDGSPWAPAEQERVVTEVERRLSVADALEATQLTRATCLRQAVLQAAFPTG